MQKIMGIDYGDARTGVAISDLLCSIVGSTYVVPSRNTEKAIAEPPWKPTTSCLSTITTEKSGRTPWMRWRLP